MLYRIAILGLVSLAATFAAADFLPRWLAAARGDAPAVAALEGVATTTAPVAPPTRQLGAREVELLADRAGHFLVTAQVDGRRVPFVVDTGATYIALTAYTARRLNIRPLASEFTVPVSTANGAAFVAPVLLDEIRIEGILVRNVWALVHRDRGLDINLLGMNFLSELRSFEMRGDRLTLSQ